MFYMPEDRRLETTQLQLLETIFLDYNQARATPQNTQYSHNTYVPVCVIKVCFSSKFNQSYINLAVIKVFSLTILHLLFVLSNFVI